MEKQIEKTTHEWLKDEAFTAGNDFIQRLWAAVGDGKNAIKKFKELKKIENKFGNTTIEKEFIAPYESLVAGLWDFLDPDGEAQAEEE